jgi:NADPH-dependent 2,4-dienoyl-CoA reductase/sulfur reductase-like enzyme
VFELDSAGSGALADCRNWRLARLGCRRGLGMLTVAAVVPLETSAVVAGGSVVGVGAGFAAGQVAAVARDSGLVSAKEFQAPYLASPISSKRPWL